MVGYMKRERRILIEHHVNLYVMTITLISMLIWQRGSYGIHPILLERLKILFRMMLAIVIAKHGWMKLLNMQ